MAGKVREVRKWVDTKFVCRGREEEGKRWLGKGNCMKFYHEF